MTKTPKTDSGNPLDLNVPHRINKMLLKYEQIIERLRTPHRE